MNEESNQTESDAAENQHGDKGAPLNTKSEETAFMIPKVEEYSQNDGSGEPRSKPETELLVPKLEEKSANNQNGDKREQHSTGHENTELVVPAAKAPDGGYGWVVVFGTMINQIIHGLIIRSFGVIYVEMLARYQGTPSVIGWIGAINMTMCGALGPLISSLSVKYTYRNIAVIGGVVTTVGVAISAYSPNIPMVYVSFGIIAGVGLSMTNTPGYLIVGEYFKKRLGLAMGIAFFGNGIGAFIFPPFITWLFEEYGYSGSLIIMAGCCLQCCVSGALFRPLAPTKRQTVPPVVSAKDLKEEESQRESELIRSKEEESPELREMQGDLKHKTDTEYMVESVNICEDTNPCLERTNQASNTHTNKLHCCCWKAKKKDGRDDLEKVKKLSMFDIELMKNKQFVGTFILVFGTMQSLALSSGYIVALIVEKGMTLQQGALVLSVNGIASSIGSLGIGAMTDIKKIKPYRVQLYSLYSFIVGVTTILHVPIMHFYEFILLGFIRSSFAGAMVAQIATIVGDLVSQKKVPNALGWLLFATSFGSLFGRAIGGTLKDAFGDYGVPFYVSGAIALATWIIFTIFTMPPTAWHWLQKCSRLQTSGESNSIKI